MLLLLDGDASNFLLEAVGGLEGDPFAAIISLGDVALLLRVSIFLGEPAFILMGLRLVLAGLPSFFGALGDPIALITFAGIRFV